jgi:SAM-dependent methyltransferase
MNELFDRKLLQQNQRRFLKNFANYNFLHNEIAVRMVENLQNLSVNYQDILEISAKNHFLKDYITKHQEIKNFFSTSLFGDDFDLIVDDEKLNFEPKSFDLALSNLNLQFINEIPQFLVKIRQILREKGVFMASFFAENNLFSLKKAVFEAENTVFGRVSPRFIPLIDVKSAGMLLQKAGFKNSVSSLEIIEVEYENTQKLLHDLKFMMLGNILCKKSKIFTNRKFFDEIYKNYVKIEGLGQGNQVKARFEVVIMAGIA